MKRPIAWVFAALFGWIFGSAVVFADSAEMTVFKDPNCGCCAIWVDHLRANGFHVAVRNVGDLDRVKQMAGVPGPLQSCHTAVIDGYVIEGHVPAASISRLLAERPNVRGLAVPGMPIGSPGMPGEPEEVYDVITFGAADPSVFETYQGERRQR